MSLLPPFLALNVMAMKGSWKHGKSSHCHLKIEQFSSHHNSLFVDIIGKGMGEYIQILNSFANHETWNRGQTPPWIFKFHTFDLRIMFKILRSLFKKVYY